MSTNTTAIEKTTKKKTEKENFIKACDVFKVFFKFGIFFMAVAFIITLVELISGDSDNTVFDNIKAIVGIIFNCVAFKYGIDIFNMLKENETPFRLEIADKIKKTGIVTLICPAVMLFVDIISIIYTILTDGKTRILVEAAPIFTGVILLMIAYVFRYGCKLQQESDETL